MNLHLSEVICTSKVRGERKGVLAGGNARRRARDLPRVHRCAPVAALLRRGAVDALCVATVQDGLRFFKMPEAYVRGNTIKYISVPEEVRSSRVAAVFPGACMHACAVHACVGCAFVCSACSDSTRTCNMWSVCVPNMWPTCACERVCAYMRARSCVCGRWHVRGSGPRCECVYVRACAWGPPP